MKQVKITFRLSPYQLAVGLQTIKQLEPTYQLLSINDMVKTIYHDYVAKMNFNKASAVPLEYIEEINKIIGTSNKKVTIDNIFSVDESPDEEEPEPEPAEEDVYDPNEELSDETLEEIDRIVKMTKKFASLVKASEFNDPNLTESEISTLTDFSPPKDWKDGE